MIQVCNKDDIAGKKSALFYSVNLFKKKTLTAFVFVLALASALQAQQSTPQLLKEPATWEFERFALPPDFAPGFPFKGVEELRFSPGMFNKNATDYFTYAFAAQLDDITNISQNDIQHYLLKYFKGLCSITARDRKLVIDTSAIKVEIVKNRNAPLNEVVYNAVLNIFGVFADGAPVKLNMEIKVLNNKKERKSYLIFIASPLEKNNAVWKQLYQIQKDFASPPAALPTEESGA